MSEQHGLQWNQADFGRRPIHLPKIKDGDPRTIPLNSVALETLGQLRGELKQPGTAPVFPTLRGSETLQGSRG